MTGLFPKISVLMPSLNVAEFIKECLNSVVSQTLKEIEIICIDAGSTDGTLEILREYEKQDRRIRVIVSDKKSYGYQMNLGLDAASGEYVGIVETDDWVEPDMFETLWNAAVQHDVDIVASNYYWYYTKPEVTNKAFENLRKCPYEVKFAPQTILTPLSNTPSIWSGIYRRSFLMEHQIRFNETPGASYQDTSFHFMVYTVAESAYFLNKYFLHYRRDNESSSVNTGGKVYCICDEMHYYEKFLEEHPKYEENLIKPYMVLKYRKYRWNYARIDPQYQWEFLSFIRNEFISHRASGLLDINYFDVNSWKNVNEIIDNPVRYFIKTCKKYCTRPMGDNLPKAEIIKRSSLDCPDISIIIPSCNNEDCIRRSIESAQKQTLVNIEIVCVDDGSDDNTRNIIMEYASQDDRINVVYQVNQGQGAARNAGLEISQGRYVQFLDSGDVLREDAAEYLVSKAKEKQLDILYFDGCSIFENEEIKEKNPYYIDTYEFKTEQKDVLTGIDYLCLTTEDGKYRSSSCMALIDRKYLQRRCIKFIDGILHEDNVFTFIAMLDAQHVWHTTEQLYFRYVHNESVIPSPKTFFHVYGYLVCFQAMLKKAQSLPYDERLDRNISTLLRGVCSSLRSTYNSVSDKKKCREKFSQTELHILDELLQESTCKELVEKEIETSKKLQQANKQLKKTNKQLKDISNSRSYKIGRVITWPVRKIKDFIKSLKPDKNWEKRLPKVLFVSSDSNKMSGAFLSETALNEILNKKFKISTHVILPYKGSGNSIMTAAGVKNHVIPSHDWIIPNDTTEDFSFFVKKYCEHTENLKAAINIAKFALKEKFNVIHSNTTYTYVGNLASRLTGIPHVWHLREFLEEDQNKKIYCKKRGYQMVGKSDRVITISNALYQKYLSVVPETKLKLIYNGISEKEYYAPQKEIFQKRVPVFLFLAGSDSYYKGRADLIKACEKLNSEGVDFELWFVGWCGLEIQNLVNEAGLTERTRFFGYQKDTANYYKHADIFFMCSRFEAFGRTTVEAMLSGCLVIGADSAGTKELIEDSVTGFLYPYGDVDKLAETIRYALVNKESMKTIADRGRSFMVKNMTSEINAQIILEEYKRILSTNRPLTRLQRGAKKIYIAWTYFRYIIRKYVTGFILQSIVKVVPSRESSVVVENKIIENKVPKVSVIVPAYNVKKYLHQCLDSICSQTLKNIEIICVNDGSTDDSDKIIHDFAQKDSRIIVIDKENSGYGASVNQGLEKATGEYIAIVETDDFIDKNMYKDLYTLAIERGSVDIIKSSYWMYYDTEDGKGVKKKAPIKAACHPTLAVFDVFEYPEIIYHHPSIWSCLYKREFINSNNIRFNEAEGAGWVDNPFLVETFCKAKRITWTPKAYYYYRQTNPGASSFVKDCSIPFKRTSEMLLFLDKENIADNAIRNSVYKRILWNAASALDNPNYVPEKDDKIITEQILRIDPQFLKDKRVRDVERRAYTIFRNKMLDTNS